MALDDLKEFMETNNTNEVKNYSKMCELLGEETTTGLGRINQKERWRLYMKYTNVGHKFIISEVYDEETIAQSVREYEGEKTLKKSLSSSDYAKDLIPILLYLLASSKNKEIMKTKQELAIICGFFNEEIEKKTNLQNYIDYRETKKEELPDKRYFKKDIDIFYYSSWLGELKKDAYSKIMTSLNILKKMGLIEYEELNVGYTGSYESGLDYEYGFSYKNDTDMRSVLNSEENKIYQQSVDRSLNEVLDAYNEVAKVKKEKITQQDLIYRYDVKDLFYPKLNGYIFKRLGYSTVLNNVNIKLIGNIKTISNDIKLVEDYSGYIELIRRINDKFVNVYKNRIDNYIKKKIKFYVKEKIGILAVNGYNIREEGEDIYCPPIGFENLTYDDVAKAKIEIRKRKPKKGSNDIDTEKQVNEEIKYYNRVEILDLLVSFDPEVEVLDLDEVEKDFFESQKDFDYKNIEDEEMREKIQGIFREFKAENEQ